jgi:drug/metabolite transporter (DMT)-like permease
VAGPLTRRLLPTKRLLIAAAVVTAGAALAQGAGSEFDPVVLLLAGGSLACEVLFSLLALPLLPRLRPIGVSTYACAIAAGLLGAVAVVVEQPQMPSATESVSLLFMAAAVTAGGFVFWYTGVDRLGVERAGLFLGLIPISALLSVGLVGTGTITTLRVAGSITVACGIVLGMTKATGARASEATRTARGQSGESPSVGTAEPPPTRGARGHRPGTRSTPELACGLERLTCASLRQEKASSPGGATST